MQSEKRNQLIINLTFFTVLIFLIVFSIYIYVRLNNFRKYTINELKETNFNYFPALAKLNKNCNIDNDQLVYDITSKNAVHSDKTDKLLQNNTEQFQSVKGSRGSRRLKRTSVDAGANYVSASELIK